MKNSLKVDEVFTSPLQELFKKENLTFKKIHDGNANFMVPEFFTQNHKVWGLTATILYYSLKILFPSCFKKM